MDIFEGLACNSPKITSNTKYKALVFTLKQSWENFKELMVELDKLCDESTNYKTQFLTQKEQCESKNCCSSEELKQVIADKDNIIQLVASSLTKLNETRDFSIVKEIFNILCGDSTVGNLTKDNKTSPKIELCDYKDESVSEIEGTPTGRKSPIIHSRRTRSGTTIDTESRDKKKCPNSWPTSETKLVKLSFPTPTKVKPNGKLRQSRFSIIKMKPKNAVDLTRCSESGASTSDGNDSECNKIQLKVKREPMDNDDTILPSPTSGPTNFSALYKTTSKNSPRKLRKPLSRLKIKDDDITRVSDDDMTNISNEDVGDVSSKDCINTLKHNRIEKPMQQSPRKIKLERKENVLDNNDSISLLQYVHKLEIPQPDVLKQNQNSPQKHPLAENINFTNVLPTRDVHKMAAMHDNTNNKKHKPEIVEAVYKEPTVRKKAEKRALPGWSCDECKNFYDELYKDDPEMLARKMGECSRHRGRLDPARARTPPGFWAPRWDVPQDTEEFNRRNDAI